MKTKDVMFEYGGLWLHASRKYSLQWQKKGESLIPPVEAFHLQLVILRALTVARAVPRGTLMLGHVSTTPGMVKLKWTRSMLSKFIEIAPFRFPNLL